jgi:hypothetical protein
MEINSDLKSSKTSLKADEGHVVDQKYLYLPEKFHLKRNIARLKKIAV